MAAPTRSTRVADAVDVGHEPYALRKQPASDQSLHLSSCDESLGQNFDMSSFAQWLMSDSVPHL